MIAILGLAAATVANEYTPPAGFDGFYADLFYLVASLTAISLGVRAWVPRKTPETPQPLVISASQRMATHEEVLQLRHEFESFKAEQRSANEQLEASIDHAVELINENGEERVTKLHDRINVLVEKTGKIIGQVEMLRRVP